MSTYTIKLDANNPTVVRGLCKHCGKYKALFHFRQTYCGQCGTEFPNIVYKATNSILHRVDFHTGRINATT